MVSDCFRQIRNAAAAGAPVSALVVINPAAVNATIGLTTAIGSGAEIAPDFCSELVHELAHAADYMAGTDPQGSCQLDGGAIAADEVKAMAVENSFLKSTGRNAVVTYGPGVYLPDDATTPSAASWQQYQQGNVCP
jgi:hypothetical protein